MLQQSRKRGCPSEAATATSIPILTTSKIPPDLSRWQFQHNSCRSPSIRPDQEATSGQPHATTPGDTGEAVAYQSSSQNGGGSAERSCQQPKSRRIKGFPHVMREYDTHNGIKSDGLFKPVQSAVDSTVYQRYECGWNHHANVPLLNSVFISMISDFVENNQTGQSAVQARFESLMTATVQGTWIPDSPKSGSTQSGLIEHITLSAVHSSSRYKKVDYVLVLDKNRPLEKAITDKVFLDASLRNQSPHVNQTIYPAIMKSPIAVSIATKKPNSGADQDPLAQLSI
ncbi:hypothetical protein F4859DRAFT_527706 [Xylaria cf. heliscus]|nr:hypothetical protein F4859DRAFT_527706 [Xylaria cf. heliscus]